MSAEDFLAVSKRLKAAGNTGLRRELNKNIRKAAKPVINETRKAARARLPKRGGLADLVAAEPQRVQVRTGAKTYGVRIVVGKRRGGARGADRGVVRHPVFGGGTWVSQPVPPGWFTETARQKAPEARKDVLEALQAVKRQVVGRG
jgi:hypothetical protein